MGFGNIPVVTKNLLIINVIIFLLKFIPNNIVELIYGYGILSFPGSKTFFVYQFFSYMFFHADFMHLLFNMFALYMFGAVIEMVWGWKRFLNFYILCGVGAAVFHILMIYLLDSTTIMNGGREFYKMLGASGAIYGLLVAFGYLFPNNIINIYFVIPIKAKYFVVILILIDLFLGFTNRSNSNVAHFAHVGGAFTGLIMCFGGNLRRWKK